jgi:hypothetical protein
MCKRDEQTNQANKDVHMWSSGEINDNVTITGKDAKAHLIVEYFKAL